MAAVDFSETFDAIGKTMQDVFPDAEATHEWNMDGWRVKVPDPPPKVGTGDPTHLYVLVAERKAGVSVHLWNPMNYAFLDEHGGPLADAGCKLMVGCFQFNRKQAFPLEAFADVLRAAKATF